MSKDFDHIVETDYHDCKLVRMYTNKGQCKIEVYKENKPILNLDRQSSTLFFTIKGRRYLYISEERVKPDQLLSNKILDTSTGELHNLDKAENLYDWNAAWPSPDGNFLVVHGQALGFLDEYRIYDISDIRAIKLLASYAARFHTIAPVFHEDGTVDIFDSEEYFIPLNKPAHVVTLEEYSIFTEEAEDPKCYESRVINIRRFLL